MALAVCLALLLTLVANQHALWPDETFSLAMATGHSLEHPASVANPVLGDYQEPPGPVAPAVFRQYAQHDEPPAGLSRVIRAVALSDLNPPLYSILLHGWTRIFGTGDFALRAFSIVWALLSLPLLRSVAYRIGGVSTIFPSMIVFFFAPFSLYYFTEGRPYSLIVFLTLALLWLTLSLVRPHPSRARLAAWSLVAATGLLTHYFFAPVVVACGAWLAYAMPARWLRLISAAGLTGLIIAPWYLQAPRLFSQWRVTDTNEWATTMIAPFGLLGAIGLLPMRFIAPVGHWETPAWAGSVALPLLIAAVMIIVWRRRLGILTGHHPLLVAMLLAALAIPILYDLSHGTYLSLIGRYAITGLPALMLLVGSLLGRLTRPYQPLVLTLLLLGWAPGIYGLVFHGRFESAPIEPIAEIINERSQPGDLIVLHSIPSGVVSLTRAMTVDTPVLSWVDQLGQRRAPEDIARLSAGYRRIVIIQFHSVGAPAPELDWLRVTAELTQEVQIGAALVSVFVPPTGEHFSTE